MFSSFDIDQVVLSKQGVPIVFDYVPHKPAKQKRHNRNRVGQIRDGIRAVLEGKASF